MTDAASAPLATFTKTESPTAALILGLVFAASDLVISTILPEATVPTPQGLQWTCLGLSLGLAALVAVLFGLTPRWFWFLLPSALAFWLGKALGRGNHAQTLALVEWWPHLATGATGLLLFTWHRMSGPRKKQIRWLLLVGSLVFFAVATWWQRGRYHEVKLAGLGLAACAMYPAALGIVATRTGRLVTSKTRLVAVLVFSFAVAAGFGIHHLRSGGPALDWTLSQTTTSSLLASELRAWTVSDLDFKSRGDGVYLPPYFGSDLERRSRRALTARGGAPRGLLVISVDALRYDLFDRKIGGRPVAPTLSALRRKSLEFTRAYCPAPISQLSFFAMLRGLYPSQYIEEPGSYNALKLITPRLEAAGVETRSMIPRGIMTVDLDELKSKDLGFGFANGHQWFDLEPGEVFAKLKPQRNGRFLSYWHTMRAHSPYNAYHPKFAAGDSKWERYAAEVRHADDDIRQVLKRFEEAGLLDDMWVIVSADHGEEFYEHGSDRHGTQLFEETVRVPFFIFGPGIEAGRCTDCISLASFAPTFDEFFDLSQQGRETYGLPSLIPSFMGLEKKRSPIEFDVIGAEVDDGPWPFEVVCDLPPAGPGIWNTASALIGPRWKLIVDERNQRLLLFDLLEDPKETQNLAHRESTIAEAMFARLRQYQAPPAKDDSRPYSELITQAALITKAEELGDLGVASLTEAVRSWPDELAIRLCCHFSDFRAPWLSTKLEARFANNKALEVQLARLALRLSNRLGSVEDWTALVSQEPNIKSPYLRAALFEVAAIRKDDRLIDAARSKDNAGPSELAAAIYLYERRGNAIDTALIETELRHESSRRRRRAASILANSDFKVNAETLKQALFVAKESWLRFSLGLASIRRAADASALMSKYLAGEDSSLHNATFSFVAVRTVVVPPFQGWYFHRQDPQSNVASLSPATPWHGVMTANEVTIPVALKGPGTLGIFMVLPLIKGKRAQIDIVIGNKRFPIREVPFDPSVPHLIRLLQGTEAHKIRLVLSEGLPEQVLLGAVLWVAGQTK
ncbi:MAG: sulfatase-like hydrolase/transferase [Planctomycetota bacterium]